MKLNIDRQGGINDSFLSGGGGNVVGPLYLASDPTNGLDALTKQYVDNSLLSLNANNLISGTLSTLRLPAMNGDLTSAAGSGSLSLSATGVAPGGYGKVTVDNKGRVINGIALDAADIPSFAWSKIVTGKPTTLSGYGITDAITASGATATGYISVSGTPTTTTQLVNKSYLDTVAGGTTSIAVGDIISKVDPTTPTGFLKCNGAELDKTTYAGLYAAIGDRYSFTAEAGSGQPWRLQYQLNSDQFNDITGWTTGTSLPSIQCLSSAIVTKNRVYLLGGFNNTSYVSTVLTAPINEDGTLGTWSTGTALPGPITTAATIVVKNRVYMFGGSSSNGVHVNTVYTAVINSDGTLGAWGNGTALPTVLSLSSSAVIKNRVYLFGGYNGSAYTNAVISAPVNTDGTIGSWVSENSLPGAIGQSPLIVTNNRIYLLGGRSNSPSYIPTVFTAPINSDGTIGIWTTSISLPSVMGETQVFVTKNRVYLLSGWTGTAYTSTVYTAIINADGTLGNWEIGTPLPGPLADSVVFATKNKIFLCSGYNNSAYTATVYTASISGGLNDYSSYYAIEDVANYLTAGSGKPWTQQYQINNTQTADITGWITDSSVLPVSISLSQAIVSKNRVYLLGRFNGGSHETAVYTAPINSDGTLGTWVAGTSLPSIVTASQAIVIKNRVYLFGGFNNTAYVNTVYTAVINSDGTLGTWSTVTALPSVLGYTQAIVTKNRVYLIGGYTTSASAVTYTAPINTDGTLGAWTTGTSLPIGLYGATAIVTKNRVYLLGGYNGTSYVSTVYTAIINADGTIGAWSANTSMPGITYGAQAIVSKNKVYVLGGWNGSTSGSNVYIAPINVDGTLGTWTSGTSLPGGVSASQAIITNNKVYLIGGANSGTNLSSIYSAPILEGMNDYSGYYGITESVTNNLLAGAGRPWEQQYQINNTQTDDITGWSNSGTLPALVTWACPVVTKNRVYLLGGEIGNNGGTNNTSVYTAPINGDGTLGAWTVASTILLSDYGTVIVVKNRLHIFAGGNGLTTYTAPINSDGTLGTWSNGNNLAQDAYHGRSAVIKDYVYLFGGGATPTSVQFARINMDGTLGTWSLSTNSLPVGLSGFTIAVTKNRVYLIGGQTGSTFLSSVYSSYINSDGTLNAWSQEVSLPATSANAGVFVTKNTVYILGGRVSGVAKTDVFIAPINSDGTLGTWTTGTSLSTATGFTPVVATNNKLHVIGGVGSNGVIQTATILEGSNDYSTYFAEDTNNYLMAGSGRPWEQQYQINSTQTADITSWTNGTALPAVLGNSQVIVTKNRVYLLGGVDSVSSTSVVYTAVINNDGTLGTWTTGTSLPVILSSSQAIFTKNRVYLIGGYASGAISTIVLTAAINSDGTIGQWSYGSQLASAVSAGGVFITQNRVYYVGGRNSGGSVITTLQTAPLNSDGTIGSWSTVSGSTLPAEREKFVLFVTKNRVYVCGGGGNSGIPVNTVYTAPINSDGTIGTWSTSANLVANIGWSHSFISSGKAYIISGNYGGGGGTNTTAIYAAPINADGTLGAWYTTTGVVNTQTYSGVSFVVKNKVYMVSGYTAAGGANNLVQYATISSSIQDYSPYYDGTLAPLNLPAVTVSSTFKIPDTTQQFDMNYFIKF